MSFEAGRIVWVKLKDSRLWWAGEVTDNYPPDIISSRSKNLIAVVKYFSADDEFEIVTKEADILPYLSEKKDDLIKKGKITLEKSNSEDLEKFISDCKKAEELSGGSPDYIDSISTSSGPIKKPVYAEIFKAPPPTPPKAPITTAPKIVSKKSTGSPTKRKVEDSSSKKFTCDHCSFITDRVNVITQHRKSHIGSYTSVAPLQTSAKRSKSPSKTTAPSPNTSKKGPSPKRGRKRGGSIGSGGGSKGVREEAKAEILADWSDDEVKGTKSEESSDEDLTLLKGEEPEIKKPRTNEELNDAFNSLLQATKGPLTSSPTPQDKISISSLKEIIKVKEVVEEQEEISSPQTIETIETPLNHVDISQEENTKDKKEVEEEEEFKIPEEFELDAQSHLEKIQKHLEKGTSLTKKQEAVDKVDKSPNHKNSVDKEEKNISHTVEEKIGEEEGDGIDSDDIAKILAKLEADDEEEETPTPIPEEKKSTSIRAKALPEPRQRSTRTIIANRKYSTGYEEETSPKTPIKPGRGRKRKSESEKTEVEKNNQDSETTVDKSEKVDEKESITEEKEVKETTEKVEESEEKKAKKEEEKNSKVEDKKPVEEKVEEIKKSEEVKATAVESPRKAGRPRKNSIKESPSPSVTSPLAVTASITSTSPSPPKEEAPAAKSPKISSPPPVRSPPPSPTKSPIMSEPGPPPLPVPQPVIAVKSKPSVPPPAPLRRTPPPLIPTGGGVSTATLLASSTPLPLPRPKFPPSSVIQLRKGGEEKRNILVVPLEGAGGGVQHYAVSPTTPRNLINSLQGTTGVGAGGGTPKVVALTGAAGGVGQIVLSGAGETKRVRAKKQVFSTVRGGEGSPLLGLSSPQVQSPVRVGGGVGPPPRPQSSTSSSAQLPRAPTASAQYLQQQQKSPAILNRGGGGGGGGVKRAASATTPRAALPRQPVPSSETTYTLQGVGPGAGVVAENQVYFVKSGSSPGGTQLFLNKSGQAFTLASGGGGRAVLVPAPSSTLTPTLSSTTTPGGGARKKGPVGGGGSKRGGSGSGVRQTGVANILGPKTKPMATVKPLSEEKVKKGEVGAGGVGGGVTPENLEKGILTDNIVHLVPVENVDGTLTYMVVQADNNSSTGVSILQTDVHEFGLKLHPSNVKPIYMDSPGNLDQLIASLSNPTVPESISTPILPSPPPFSSPLPPPIGLLSSPNGKKRPPPQLTYPPQQAKNNTISIVRSPPSSISTSVNAAQNTISIQRSIPTIASAIVSHVTSSPNTLPPPPQTQSSVPFIPPPPPPTISNVLSVSGTPSTTIPTNITSNEGQSGGSESSGNLLGQSNTVYNNEEKVTPLDVDMKVEIASNSSSSAPTETLPGISNVVEPSPVAPLLPLTQGEGENPGVVVESVPNIGSSIGESSSSIPMDIGGGNESLLFETGGGSGSVVESSGEPMQQLSIYQAEDGSYYTTSILPDGTQIHHPLTYDETTGEFYSNQATNVQMSLDGTMIDFSQLEMGGGGGEQVYMLQEDGSVVNENGERVLDLNQFMIGAGATTGEETIQISSNVPQPPPSTTTS